MRAAGLAIGRFRRDGGGRLQFRLPRPAGAPPREYLIVLAALAATGIHAGLMAALRECALVAGGALIAGLITMAPVLGRRREIPQLRALSRVWEAVADVLGAGGTPRCR
jgi:hypothetical protein